MAWLIFKRSGKKKTSRGKSKKSTNGFAANWTPERTLLALRCAAVVAVVGGLVAGWYYSERSLRQYVKNSQSARVDVSNVTLADQPDWMGAWLSNDLSAIVAQRVSADPMDGKSLADAATALERNPWVARVHRIERHPNRKVVVQASFHRPAAVVGGDAGYHLVTQNGMLLPGVYRNDQLDVLGLPVIEGVGAAPVAEGAVWPGEDLQAGLDLVNVLKGEWYLPQLSSIRVDQRDRMGRIRLMLITRTGGTLIWGLPPGEDQVVEASTHVKRERLRIYSRNGMPNHTGDVLSLHTTRAWRQADDGASVGYTSMR